MRGLRPLLRAAVPAPLRRLVWRSHDWAAELQQRVFERRLGARTSGHLYLDDVGQASEGRAFYEGCQWLPVRRVLASLRPGPDDVFVDLGSGKGQALLIAGLLPFGRVVGVELVDELTTAAQRNIDAARPRLRASSVEAVTADVLEWPVPDDLSVVFLYCPFTGPLFAAAMERIFASYDRNPRPLHLVYAYPWEHNWLLRSGRVVVEDVRPAQWPTTPWWWRSGWSVVTYRVVGPGAGGPGVPDVRRRLFRPRRALRKWGGPHDHVFKLVRDGRVVATSDPGAAGHR